MADTTQNEADDPIDDGSAFDPPLFDAPDEFSKEDLEKLLKDGEEKPASVGFVPISRFNEINTKWREEQAVRQQLEEKLNSQQKPLPQDSSYDFKAKELEYMRLAREAEYDDDALEQASALRQEINDALMAQAQSKALAEIEGRQHHQRKQQELEEAEAVADQIAQKYPFLDVANGGSQDAVDDFAVWRDNYIRKGVSLTEALRLAADKVAAIYGDDNTGKSSQRQDDRTAEALRRGMEASKRQPPPPAGRGARSQDHRDLEITEKTIKGMDEQEKARLRGDYID